MFEAWARSRRARPGRTCPRARVPLLATLMELLLRAGASPALPPARVCSRPAGRSRAARAARRDAVAHGHLAGQPSSGWRSAPTRPMRAPCSASRGSPWLRNDLGRVTFATGALELDPGSRGGEPLIAPSPSRSGRMTEPSSSRGATPITLVSDEHERPQTPHPIDLIGRPCPGRRPPVPPPRTVTPATRSASTRCRPPRRPRCWTRSQRVGELRPPGGRRPAVALSVENPTGRVSVEVHDTQGNVLRTLTEPSAPVADRRAAATDPAPPERS